MPDRHAREHRHHEQAGDVGLADEGDVLVEEALHGE